jgi:CTP synthase (UTP-ammonia lyase)
VGWNLKQKPIISLLEKVQPKLGVLVRLEAELKLQISVLHAKLGVLVLISAQAEMKTKPTNFSCTEIPWKEFQSH